MGPSGSGKTTLLTMLGGLLRPTGGAIVVGGHELTALSESQLPELRAHTFGFIFQDFNLMPSLSARENVEIALNIAGVHGRAAHERAQQLLERLGLTERIGFLPEQLSGGEKQRVAIARALANEPALILADEPTANLDSHHGREVMRELRRIAKDEGRSIVIVSHDQRLKDIADRVLWLEDGRFSREDELVVDPVCGMSLERADARNSLEADGETYWFCCQGCQHEFAEKLAHPDIDRGEETTP
jgi:putative ABC transport system ATP-binding protein